MKSNLQPVLALGIALCLGFTWACVKVNVSATSQGPSLPHRLSPMKPSISLDDLKKLHTTKTCDLSSKDVAKELQQTAAWCWSASTRMVMEYQNRTQEPPKPTALQCDIVRNVFSPGIGAANCCEIEVTSDFIDAPAVCVQGGWPHWVFDKYRFNYETVAGVLDWDALTGEICSTGPFVSIVEWSGGGRHAFIVKGYEIVGADGEKTVQVYDPILNDRQDMTYEEFAGDSPREQHGFQRFSHDLDFVQILPIAKVKP